MNPAILALPQVDGYLTVDVDACDTQLGYILLQ